MEKIRLITERPFLRAASIHVGMKAEIAGDFTDDQFLAAVQKTCIKHPLLRATITISADRQAYYVLNSSKEIEVSFFQDNDPHQWMQWFEDADNSPFDFETGPLLKIAVFRKVDSAIVVLLGHHILGDGLGYLNLVKDLLMFLNGAASFPPLLPPLITKATLFPKGAKLPLLTRFLIHRLNVSWRKTGRVFTRADYEVFFRDYRSHHPPGLFINSMDEKETKTFLARCHEMGVSVNEAVLTAFVYAIQKHDQEYAGKKLEAGIAINVRKELTPQAGECMGNFVSGVLVNLQYDYRNSFLENAVAIREIVRPKITGVHSRFAVLKFLLELDSDLLDSIGFAAYGDYDNAVSKKVAHIVGEHPEQKGIGISNLGKIAIEAQDSRYTLRDLVFIQPAYPANAINIGVLTCNNRMNFCLRFIKNEKSDRLIETITAEAIEKINEW